jgi:eukaryotic-like serine/threonine-protein kinase
MDSERWKRIDNLLQAALERPPAARAEFLRQACAGDEALEREIRSLAANEREVGSFLEKPPAALLASERWQEIEELLAQVSRTRTSDQPPAALREESTVTHLAGQTISHYQILEMLGAGGMGVVYKAFDTKLDRHVALKFLPPHLRHNDELKQRLKEEARAASTLDHPNIVVIYDIDEAPGGDLFIAMAFHEGVTLRDKIGRDKSSAGLPLAEALQIARQIALGLAKAHERGIFHRDIKPSNVVVAKDGVTRIIDFGLAKSSETTATLDGTTKGTPLYMSPEQASGKPVDFRTDLWSLGAVLYEMLAGRPPFQGETQLQVMRAVVQDGPAPLRELRPGLSPEVEAIVARALQKDPARRYQSAAEMAGDLSAVLSGFDISGSTRAAVPAATGIRRRALSAAAILVALAAGALLAWRFGAPHRPVTSANEYIQLTNFNDSATAPALSADGRMVTFFRGGEYFLGSGQIYVKLLPDGESKQLTFDSNQKYGPVFTPDASRVAYTALSMTAGSFDTWTVPVLGGPPARLMVNAAGLSWIGPDRVLFSEIMAGTALHMGIVTAKESRAEERPIYFPAHERAMAHYSWLSPDRGWVLVVEMNGGVSNWQRCRVVPMDGSSAGVPVGPQGACTAAAWSPDGRWMYLNVKVAGSTHLWRQRWRERAPQGDPEQITLGPTEEEGLAMAPDGKSLIASVGVQKSSVWTHDAAGNHAVSLEGSASAPWLSPDGKRLYYLLRKSNSSDVSDLWRRDLQSGKSDPVLTGQRIVDYDVSRDEAKVAFTVRVGGESQIFLAATDRSSPPRLVVKGGDEVSFGAGQLFFRQAGGKADYPARVQEDGSGLTRILETKTTEVGGVSPDGEWATVADIGSLPGEFVVGVRRRAQRKICAGVCFVRWSADGKYLYVSPVTRFSATESALPTYIIPIPHGVERLDLPASGIDWANQTQLAGLQSIPQGNMSPGPDPQTYAFTITAFQGNLFRIPLH